MLPFFKILKGLIDIDVSHFVDFYANCDYYSFRPCTHVSANIFLRIRKFSRPHAAYSNGLVSDCIRK